MKEKLDENGWLDQLIDIPVVVYLGNGIKLSGVFLGHDVDVLFLGPEEEDGDAPLQMIYKGFCSTIAPQRNGIGHGHHFSRASTARPTRSRNMR